MRKARDKSGSRIDGRARGSRRVLLSEDPAGADGDLRHVHAWGRLENLTNLYEVSSVGAEQPPRNNTPH